LTGIYQKRKNSSVKRNDILQILIDTQDAENIEDRMSTEVLLRETVMYLIAGTETTSNTLSFALISLLRYPDSLRKLYQEIDTVPMKDENDIFNHEPLKQLPYLNAVINETLRLNPVASNGLPRCTVQETTLGNNLVLPKDVSM
jgi:cytochrome P450